MNRQPAGTPTGGRFAPSTTAESAASLVASNADDRWSQDRVRELDLHLQEAGWDKGSIECEDDNVSLHLPEGSQYRITPLRRDGGQEYVVEYSATCQDEVSGPYGETVQVGTTRSGRDAVDLVAQDSVVAAPGAGASTSTGGWDPTYDQPPF